MKSGNQPAFTDKVPWRRRNRVLLLRRLLRVFPHDFESYGRVVAIIGDDIGDEIRAVGRYEDVELRAIEALLFRHLPCDQQQCLDIGANIGNHTLFFSRFFARVIAFEPNPIACTLLNLNLSLNGVSNVEVHTVGLSNAAGTAHLSVCRDNLGASRLRHLAERSPAFLSRVASDVEIKLVRGDSIIDSRMPVGFVKIDVEGHECEGLQGIAETIGRDRPVIMVEQLASSMDAETGRPGVAGFLEALGYRPFEIRRTDRSRVNLVNRALRYLLGSDRYTLAPLRTIERRNYSALLYLTGEIAERITSQ
jgi:FkbM family methyltransferase